MKRRMTQIGIGAITVAMAAGLIASIAVGQDNKSTDVSKIQRLNRAPVNKEALKVQLPRPTIAKLPNGMTLVLLEDHKLPTVTFSMWIRPGQLADPADLPGLASFTSDMLREGTEKRNSLQIAAELDSLGATLNANSRFGASFSTVNASGLAANAAQILDLMSDVVMHPAFLESELAKYKERESAALEQRLSNPAALAQQTFRRALYGDGTLGLTLPTKEAIAKVTVADLKKFHDQHFRPGNTIVGVAGDFKTSDMRALIEKYFGAWAGAAEAPAVPSPQLGAADSGSKAARSSGAFTLVNRPDSVQTYILAGDMGIKRTDPDFYALVVMNQIVGGGPQARLFLDLREEHSYTYGAYSSFNTEIYGGDWLASTSVRTPVTDGSVTQLLYEFKRINNEPVPQAELDDARHAIVAGFALALEQPNEVLNNWMTAQYYGLPMDYWDRYADRIAAVDGAAVQAAAKKFVDLNHMQWVAVGDAKQIQPVLAKYGSVKVVDVDGAAKP